MLRHLDLFSGIGGFALAARMVGGYETVGFCEIEPYCQTVLRKHWPKVPIYDDIRRINGSDVGHVDIITAGFPCQDISLAGKGAGIDGERSGLWSEAHKLIRELRPRYALLENVSALLGRGMGRVLGDLAAIGYDAEWDCVPAAAVGALHYRDRVWITAYPNTNSVRPQRVRPLATGAWGEQQFARLVQNQIQLSVPAGRLRSLSDGVSGRMGQLKGYGNAIVPQVAAIFLQAIKEVSVEQEREQEREQEQERERMMADGCETHGVLHCKACGRAPELPLCWDAEAAERMVVRENLLRPSENENTISPFAETRTARVSEPPC